MYFILSGPDCSRRPDLMEQMFRLRAKVFQHELGWVNGDSAYERDQYDDHTPIYVMHTDPTGTELYACGRLMPTSGPTLLRDVFGETSPDIDFASPFVWEITRLCIDDDKVRAHGRDAERMTILRSLHVAALEFGVTSGVEAYLANFDPLRHRMWRRMGVEFDILGRTEAFSCKVLLGITECSPEVLEDAREALGASGSILDAIPAVPTTSSAPEHPVREAPLHPATYVGAELREAA